MVWKAWHEIKLNYIGRGSFWFNITLFGAKLWLSADNSDINLKNAHGEISKLLGGGSNIYRGEVRVYRPYIISPLVIVSEQ